jgi:hypothetical protein
VTDIFGRRAGDLSYHGILEFREHLTNIGELPSKSIQVIACSWEYLGVAAIFGKLEVDSSYDNVADMQEALDVDFIAYPFAVSTQFA